MRERPRKALAEIAEPSGMRRTPWAMGEDFPLPAVFVAQARKRPAVVRPYKVDGGSHPATTPVRLRQIDVLGRRASSRRDENRASRSNRLRPCMNRFDWLRIVGVESQIARATGLDFLRQLAAAACSFVVYARRVFHQANLVTSDGSPVVPSAMSGLDSVQGRDLCLTCRRAIPRFVIIVVAWFDWASGGASACRKKVSKKNESA